MQKVPAKSVPISPSPRLVLFDLDDTLCDYASARLVRLRTAFSMALEGSDAAQCIDLDNLVVQSLEMHPHGTDHFPELFRRNGLDHERAAEIAGEWYRAHRFHTLALFDDTVEALKAVRRLQPSRTIGMITNGPSEVQRAKIELLDVERHVDFLLISEEFGASKPDPSIFQEALRLGNAHPDDAVFIGDSPEYDIAGAQAARIRAIWMNRAGRNWPDGALPPDHEVCNLGEVLALLDIPG